MKSLCSTFVVVCALAVGVPHALGYCTVPQDEMQVLISYLRSAAGRTPTVLVTSTRFSKIDIDYLALQLGLNGHGVPAAVKNDLKSKNVSTCALGPIWGVRNLLLMSKEEHDRIFQVLPSRGWAEFHKRYGMDASLALASRVGLNSERTVAMFYITEGSGPMAGSSCLYVFRQQNGKWIKDAEVPVWYT